VAAVWSDVLGVERVGVHDDFFALGGDSIRSLKVVARLRAVGVPAAVGDLYRHPTVRDLAGAVDPGGTGPAGAPPTAPDPRPSTPYDLVNAADLAILTRRHGGSSQ
jgi:aryl carrier-like protein